MEREEEKFEFDPFNVDLNLLQEVGNIIPDEVVEEEIETQSSIVTSEETEESDVITNDEENKGAPSSQEITDTSPFTPYAKLLVEEGITPNLDISKFDGKAETLLKAVQDEINYGVEKYKETNLHPRLKWLQDNLDDGVALKDLLELDNEKIYLSKITEEVLENDQDVQRDVLKRYFKETTKLSEAVIDKQIERIEATGDLLEESKKFYDELNKFEVEKEKTLQVQSKKAQEDAEKAQIEMLRNFQDTLAKTEEVVSGVKVTPILRDKIYKTLTTVVDIDSFGNPVNKIAKARMEDPIGFEIKLGYLFEATNGFKDWTVFQGTGKKAAIKDFEESVKKMDFTGYKQPTNKQSTSVDKDLLKDMDKIVEMGKQRWY